MPESLGSDRPAAAPSPGAGPIRSGGKAQIRRKKPAISKEAQPPLFALKAKKMVTPLRIVEDAVLVIDGEKIRFAGAAVNVPVS